MPNENVSQCEECGGEIRWDGVLLYWRCQNCGDAAPSLQTEALTSRLRAALGRHDKCNLIVCEAVLSAIGSPDEWKDLVDECDAALAAYVDLAPETLRTLEDQARTITEQAEEIARLREEMLRRIKAESDFLADLNQFVHRERRER